MCLVESELCCGRAKVSVVCWWEGLAGVDVTRTKNTSRSLLAATWNKGPINAVKGSCYSSKEQGRTEHFNWTLEEKKTPNSLWLKRVVNAGTAHCKRKGLVFEVGKVKARTSQAPLQR